MHSELKPWQLVVLLLLFPPVGTFFVCLRGNTPVWCKIAAAVYCLVVFIALLTLRRPAGDIFIIATPVS